MSAAFDSHIPVVEGRRAKGMDYGTPPRFMLVANPIFGELWQAAGCAGLGYMQIPRFRGEADVPLVCFMCDNADRGVELFRLLKSWDSEPDSGKGVDVSFVVDQPNRSYTLFLAPNGEEFLARLPDQSVRKDYNVITTAMVMGKPLTDTHGGVSWLRTQVAHRPILLAPGDRSGPRMEHAIKKTDVKFYDADKVPEDTIEHFAMAGNAERRARVAGPVPIQPTTIAQRRQRQLKRFFGVTLARLDYNESLRLARQRLASRHAEWQISQAACNLLAVDRFPEITSSEKGIVSHDLYEAMRRTAEPIADDLPLKRRFTDHELEAQIVEDCRYLQEQLELKGSDPLQTLRKNGLLQ